MCGTLCAAGEICSNGACVLSCQQGLTKCTAADGGGVQDGGLGKDYCANLQSDNANCGACGNQCPNGQFCSPGADGGMSTCGLGCFGGTTKCGNKCVDLAIDPAHLDMDIGLLAPRLPPPVRPQEVHAVRRHRR